MGRDCSSGGTTLFVAEPCSLLAFWLAWKILPTGHGTNLVTPGTLLTPLVSVTYGRLNIYRMWRQGHSEHSEEPSGRPAFADASGLVPLSHRLLPTADRQLGCQTRTHEPGLPKLGLILSTPVQGPTVNLA